MPGMRGSEKRKTKAQVGVRLSSELHTSVDSAAACAGLTPPAWIRARIAEAVGAEPAAAFPATTKRRRAPAPEHVLAIHSLREHVAELSGSMTIAAVDTRKQGHAVLHAKIEALLPSVKAMVRELDILKKSLDPDALP